MNCPLLTGERIKSCAAMKATVYLSLLELETYCQSGRHRQCPVFKIWRQRKGKELSIADYHVSASDQTGGIFLREK